MRYTVPDKLRGTVTQITDSGADSTAVFELHGGRTKITVNLPKDAKEKLGLKKNAEACMVIIRPTPGVVYNKGQKMATVRTADGHSWVTIPYGPMAPVLEEDTGKPRATTSSSAEDEAHRYGYRTPDDFRDAISNASGGCAQGSVFLQIENVFEKGVWISYPSGPCCEAQIRNIKEKQNPSDSRKDALLHGYPDEGEYNNAKSQNNSNTFTDNVPVLAGFSYGGTDQNPELYDTRPLAVNSYIGTQKIGRIQITGIQ
jgi:hypothetical protein